MKEKQLVFLVEERSICEVLDILLPVLLPKIKFTLIYHKGKSNLEKSIPGKLRGWKTAPEAEVQFVVVRDQDRADCKKVKQHLKKLCEQGGRPDTLVRIVCHELEAWFLGDLRAVEAAYGITGLAKQQLKEKYRAPDKIVEPLTELRKLVKDYQKVSGARAIALHMEVTANCSHSFQVFVKGIRKIVQS